MKKKIISLLLLLAPMSGQAMPGYFEPWGKDADLRQTKTDAAPLPKLSLAGKVANQVILFHQNVISPVDGPRSHFRPTSAKYMQKAIYKHGFVKGFIMGCDRLLRENGSPWHYRMIEIDGKLYQWDPVP